MSTKFLLFSLIILLSCKRGEPSSTISPAYYYWKTSYKTTPLEEDALKSHKIKKIYLRFFDVDWKVNLPIPLPQGIVKINGILPSQEIIPVVYVTNNTLVKVPLDSITSLASKIGKATASIADLNNLNFKEFQMDCDWTLKTKDKYFLLLKHIKLIFKDKVLSATIRLHQIKYSETTGIPPVDRGMLMFYNMGKLNSFNKSNSIFNRGDAEKYIESIKTYELPLDVALPIFSWLIQVRKNKIINLISKADFNNLEIDSSFAKKEENCFIARHSFYYKGNYLKKGDLIRIEKITKDELIEAAQMVAHELKKEQRAIALFDLDEMNIRKYEKETFEEVFNYFN